MQKIFRDEMEFEDKQEQIKENFCDHYCKYPSECEDDEELMDICENCPLNKLQGKE